MRGGNVSTSPSTFERGAERGDSLVEVLVAMGIMLVILLSVLQLFSMALLAFHASSAQAEMTRKAESVVEVIRIVNATGKDGNSGILPLQAGPARQLPYTGESYDQFWGPNGYGVMEPESRFQVSYEIQLDASGTEALVTVFVEPRQTGAAKYLGSVDTKGVRYAARIPL